VLRPLASTCLSILLFISLSACVSSQKLVDALDERDLYADTVAALEQQYEKLLAQRDRIIGERDGLSRDLTIAQQRISQLQEDLLRAGADLDRLEKVLSARSEEAGKAMSEMRQHIDILKEENRQLSQQIDQERIAREVRFAQMKSTYDQLVGKMEEEIARGEITISDLQGKLTVNMVEKILFDSGSAEIKSSGLSVLKRVGDILRDVTDKEIRVEGHTDNVPISSRLQEKFPSNWELSTARATNVVHFLEESVGISGELLFACGFGEYRPVADNDSASGRAQNRRIMIVLVPREDLPPAP